MVARAVVLPPDGIVALRRRLAILSRRGRVLVVACRGPLGSFDDIVDSGVALENVMVLDATVAEDPMDGAQMHDPALFAFGEQGLDTVQGPDLGQATIVIDDLVALFGMPDPQGLLSLVREVKQAVFPQGADIEYVTPPGMVPPATWAAIAETVDEVLPLLDTGRLERVRART